MESDQPVSFVDNLKWENTQWLSKFTVENNKITLNHFDPCSLVSKDPIPHDRPISITFTVLEGKGYPIWFGITSAAHKQQQSIQFGQDIVYYYSSDGRKPQGFVSLNDKICNQSKELTLKNGHQVTMTVDSKKQEISWDHNGKPLGVNTFPALTEKDFYIFVHIWKEKSQIQLS